MNILLYFNGVLCLFLREVLGNVEVMQLDFEMENFTSLSVTRRINWNIDYKGQSPPPESEKVVTELTVVQRDIQAIIPLAMVSGQRYIRIQRFKGHLLCKVHFVTSLRHQHMSPLLHVSSTSCFHPVIRMF